MEKPIVFLSHSSKDKSQLVALKTLLDTRAVGSLEFFLSSDGQSIRFGRNWVVSISDALAEAKLMFAFLSPNSVDSKWIHFEAGWANARGIQVVPVCLPGLDLNRVTPPLSLLQGFNLHSHEAMANIARICNETFGLKMIEAFGEEDFETAFTTSILENQGFFGKWSWAVERVTLTFESDDMPATETFDPSPKLVEICKASGVRLVIQEGRNEAQEAFRNLDLHGCFISITQHKLVKRSNPSAPHTEFRQARTQCALSPELFHITAPLLDKWHAQVPFPKPWKANIVFNPRVSAEQARHKLTTRLYNSGILPVDLTRFEFDGLVFRLFQGPPWQKDFQGRHWSLDFQCNGQLHDKRLPQLVDRLFENQALFENPISVTDYE